MYGECFIYMLMVLWDYSLKCTVHLCPSDFFYQHIGFDQWKIYWYEMEHYPMQKY